MVKETKTESPVLFMSEASFSYAGGHSGAGVEGISLSLGKGEVALLCGPSGCGKTTVTRLANGLAPHFYEGTETGTVRVCGLDVAHAELWETARFVGSVFQNPKTQFYNVDVRGGKSPSDARTWDSNPPISNGGWTLRQRSSI